MNLEKNLRKEMEKGQALLGQPRLPFGPASGPACSPSPSLPRADARLVPASVGPVATVRRRWAHRGRPASPGRVAGPGSQAVPFALSPAPLSFLPPLASATEAAELRRSAIAGAAPLLTAGHSSDQTSTPKPPTHSPSLG